MPHIHYRLPVIICILACLLWTAEAPAKRADVAPGATVRSTKREPHQRSASVTKWFSKYDQIRRDAEMTLGDKLQSLLLAAAKPDKKNAALASRMIEKYTTAVSEMNKLQSVPETRRLQVGYIEYFSTARQLFGDYLHAQKVVPFTNRSLIPTKKKLEQLDKTNKKLDDELRKQYIITRHKHR
jgi:hypothetical protein